MDIKRFYSTYFKSGKVSIDSRQIERGDVFFAFSGERFDAATVADTAIGLGASAVIVENKKYENLEKNIFYVSSTLKFLQDLALYHREQFKIPVIALTGSNGKTTTKELISAVLTEKYKVQFTKGNLNNHIGVPLTLLSITDKHQIAVIEMGANHRKEIELLSSLVKPNIGYITNFGQAHLEGFGGFEGVVLGKSELYDYLIAHHQTILVNESDPIQVDKTKIYSQKITFGSPKSDYQFEKFTENNLVGIIYKGKRIKSNLTGEYNFTNICAAISLGLHFEININDIKKAVENYKPTNMRSQIVQKEDKILVLDTYNANPSSMTMSLNNFNQFEGSKTIIIGDMLELGKFANSAHREIISLAEKLNFNEIITVGKIFKMVNHSEKAFENTDELIEYLTENPIKTENVLLKGSRGIALERAIDFI